MCAVLMAGCGKREEQPAGKAPEKKVIAETAGPDVPETPREKKTGEPKIEGYKEPMPVGGEFGSTVGEPKIIQTTSEPIAVVEDVSGPSGWQHAGWGGGGFFWCASFDPSDGNTIYLGGDVGGVYKSTDKGLHFRFINDGLGDYAVYSLTVSKSDPRVLYVLTESGVCRSDNGGENWTYLEKTDKNGLNLISHRPKSVRALAVDPQNSNIVYAGSKTGRLYKSADAGETWKQLDYLSGPEMSAQTTAYSGKGVLALTFQSSSGSWENCGRTQCVFPDGKNLSGYLRLGVMLRTPADAPKVQAQLVVQTGEKWVWQDSPFADLAPGKWTEVSFDLSKVTELESVRAAYIILRSPESAFKGEVDADSMTVSNRKGFTVLYDWEVPGSSEGWKKNTSDRKYLLVTDVRQAGGGSGIKPKGVLSSVTVSPADPKLVFAASSAHGLFRSTDGGQTWKKVKGQETAAHAAFSSDGKTVYASLWDKGIIKSSDSGETWSKAVTGIDPSHTVREIAVHPGNPDIAYAISQKGWNGMVYKTVDGGTNWKALTREITNTETSGNPTSSSGHAQLSRLSNITLNPENPDEIFMSANWRNIFSKDGGATWEERSSGADITCFEDLQFIGTDVYAVAMDEGLFTSHDNGSTWIHLYPPEYVAGLSGHQWRVRLQKKPDGSIKTISTLYPWENKGGPYKILLSEDGGKTVTHTTAGLPTKITHKDTMWGNGYPRAMAVHPKNPDIIYLGIDGDPEPEKGIEGGGVFRSDDGGKTWKRTPGQPASRRMFFGLDIDPTDPKRIYWATCGDKGGIYMSEDEGASWNHVFKKETWFFNLAVNSKGVVYAGANNLYRSTDKGKTWELAGDFKDNWSVVGIAFDPDNENRMWVSQVPWGNRAQGAIHVTEDNCQTWRDMTGDIPYKKPMILRYNSRTEELWAAGVGVYRIKQ